MKIIAVILGFSLSLTTFNTASAGTDNPSTETIEGIVLETLDMISGDSGEIRDWESFRFLFAPNATFSVVIHRDEGPNILRSYSLEEFVRLGMKVYESSNFSEIEIKKTIDEYNGIAHVFQSYYVEQDELSEHGINSYQLFFDGDRWWITNLIWTSDRNGVELPIDYQN